MKFHFNALTWDHFVHTIVFILALIVESNVENPQQWHMISSIIFVILFLVTIIHTILWVYGTINQMTRELDINIFTISQKGYEKGPGSEEFL